MRSAWLATLGVILFEILRLAPAADDRRPKVRLIPAGAIRTPLPDVRQTDAYSCGAYALMSVCSYYGVGHRTIEEIKIELGTNDVSGTNYRNMIKYARGRGLYARAKEGMTQKTLETAVREGHPVIVALQAYADEPEVYHDAHKHGDGHYAVVIGFDDQNYYFEDPSLLGCRAFLPKDEFLRRWHDNEGDDEHPRIVKHLGLEFGPGTTGGSRLEKAQWME